jgi:hypothetical protein
MYNTPPCVFERGKKFLKNQRLIACTGNVLEYIETIDVPENIARNFE